MCYRCINCSCKKNYKQVTWKKVGSRGHELGFGFWVLLDLNWVSPQKNQNGSNLVSFKQNELIGVIRSLGKHPRACLAVGEPKERKLCFHFYRWKGFPLCTFFLFGRRKYGVRGYEFRIISSSLLLGWEEKANKENKHKLHNEIYFSSSNKIWSPEAAQSLGRP